MCFQSSIKNCTCNLKEGLFWLRRETTDQTAYCEKLPYTDFSRFQNVQYDVNKSDTNEYTLEFWFNIHHYVNTVYSFLQLDLIWDLHTRVKLVHSIYQITVDCYPLTEASDLSKNSEKLFENMFYNQWNFVRCGANFRTSKFFMNSNETTLNTINQLTTSNATVPFHIKTPDGSKTNYGFVFVKNLRFFRQYNFKLINTARQELTTNLYPGLLHYYTNKFKYTINENKTISYYLEDSVDLTRKHFLFVRFDWLSYNVVGTTYTPLVICPENQYWDSTLTSCQSKLLTSNSQYSLHVLQFSSR